MGKHSARKELQRQFEKAQKKRKKLSIAAKVATSGKVRGKGPGGER